MERGRKQVCGYEPGRERRGVGRAEWEAGGILGDLEGEGEKRWEFEFDRRLQQASWRAGSDASTSSGSGSTSSLFTSIWTSVLGPHHAIANGILPGDMTWTDLNSAPSWGVRTLKFKKKASGKVVLVFMQVS